MISMTRRRFLRLAAGSALPGALAGCDRLAGDDAFNGMLRRAPFLHQRGPKLLTGAAPVAPGI